MRKRRTKPVVAVTMGDPAGVGPEVVIKALSRPEVRRSCRPLVLGDLGVLRRIRSGKGPCPELLPWIPGEPISIGKKAVSVYPLSSLSVREARPGSPSRSCGEAAYRYIRAAAGLALSGEVDAVATAPINKRTLQLAGHKYPGHTELLAELTRTRECRMMLLGERLRVVLATVHLPLMKVARALSAKGVGTTLALTHRALKDDFAIRRPRIAVAALNPHAGEEGIFGDEEKRIILPAVRRARGRGMKVYGPLPADSLFYRAAQGDYDAVVCMYHDQGLIPLKLLHFFTGVQMTLGLPIIRTSVDHGTAYDIAGKGKADGSSMTEAILLAARLALKKNKRKR